MTLAGTGSACDAEYDRDTHEEYLPGGGNCGIKWSDSGCGWEVRDTTLTVPTYTGPLTCTDCLNHPHHSTCCDTNGPTNYIFGQYETQALEDAEASSVPMARQFDSNMCDSAKDWLEGATGYCQNVVFRGLCPQTCNVPCTVR